MTSEPHKVVSREQWLAARKAHLKNEKALTRMRDLVAADRRRLPWVKMEKDYGFIGPEGRTTLGALFGRNNQLIVHHFMFAPDWDAGCASCSLDADHAEGALVHLQNHGVSYVRVSRAPVDKIERYKKRMGWKAEWVSSHESDFNYDFHVSFTNEQIAAGKVEYNYGWVDGAVEHPGLSVFYRNASGEIFHTYSSYARGNEEVASVFVYLDLTPEGRNETEIMDWVKRHDEY